jgi:hypothetical protein
LAVLLGKKHPPAAPKSVLILELSSFVKPNLQIIDLFYFREGLIPGFERGIQNQKKAKAQKVLSS